MGFNTIPDAGFYHEGLTRDVPNRRYDYDYFDGSKVQMYIGDILIDDCVRIHFNVLEKMRTIFGCNDRFFSSVVGGQVIVQGRFAILFKEKAYLPIILKYIQKNKVAPVRSNGTGYQYKGQAIEKSPDIEQALKLMVGGQSLQAEDLLMNSLHWTNDVIFENEAENLENRIWKKTQGDGTGQENYILDRPLIPIPFDIYVLYGDYSAAATDMVNHTAIKLESCFIAGESQIIEVGGQPIIETYDFIARRKK